MQVLQNLSLLKNGGAETNLLIWQKDQQHKLHSTGKLPHPIKELIWIRLFMIWSFVSFLGGKCP